MCVLDLRCRCGLNSLYQDEEILESERAEAKQKALREAEERALASMRAMDEKAGEAELAKDKPRSKIKQQVCFVFPLVRDSPLWRKAQGEPSRPQDAKSKTRIRR